MVSELATIGSYSISFDTSILSDGDGDENDTDDAIEVSRHSDRESSPDAPLWSHIATDDEEDTWVFN